MSASRKFKIQEATIADIHAAFQSGELTARELVEMYLARTSAPMTKKALASIR